MAKRLNRTAVVEQATVLANRIGLDGLTITKLAKELGIAAPGVYRHISDIDDLRRAISQQATREITALLSVSCAGLSGVDALHALASTLRTWAAQYPASAVALQIAPDPNDGEGVAAAEELISVLAVALRNYQLSGDDLTDAIRLIRSTIHGFIILELSQGFKQPRASSDTFERIINALDMVLREWST